MDVVGLGYVLSKGGFLSVLLRLDFRVYGSYGSLVSYLVRIHFFFHGCVGSGLFLLFRLQVSVLKAFGCDYYGLCGRYSIGSRRLSIATYASWRATRGVSAATIEEWSAVEGRGYCKAGVIYGGAREGVYLVVCSMLLTKRVACVVSRYFRYVSVGRKVCVLCSTNGALGSRAYVGILLSRIYVITISIVIRLTRCIVPSLRMAIALASSYASQFSASMFFSAIVMSLQAQAA